MWECARYFVMISKTEALDLGEFPYPEWYKKEKEKEKENILSNVGIKLEYAWQTFEGFQYEKTLCRPGDRIDEFLIGESELEYTECKEFNGTKYFII